MGDAIIPSDWEDEYCLFAVCWPNSPQWLAVLRGALSIPQEGRFWDEASGTIKDAQAIVEKTFNYNFRNEEVLMACNDVTAQALNNIALALQNMGSGGCGNSGTGGNVTYCYSSSESQVQNTITLSGGEQFPVYGKGPISALPESGYPVGYDTVEAYDADKCAKSNKMIDDWIATLANIGITFEVESVLGAGFLVGCLVGLIALPAVAIPIALYILLTTATISAGSVALSNYIAANHDEAVCLLYDNGTVETILEAVGDWLDIAVSAISVEGAVAAGLKRLAMLLLSADTLNKLFTDAAKDLYPDVDCSGCGAPLPVLQIQDHAGEWVDSGWNWGEEVNFTPTVNDNGFYYLMVRIAFEGEISPGDYHLEVTSITAGNNGSCQTLAAAPGTYEAQLFSGEPYAGWQFGCTNSFVPNLVGTFNLPV